MTPSAGNHAQGVGFSARVLGVEKYVRIYLPMRKPAGQTPIEKIERTAAYGVQVVERGKTFDDARDAALADVEATKALFIHPYDDLRIMIGQATLALELLSQLDHVETIVCPIGGGGLIGGVAAVAKAMATKTNRSITVIGVEEAGSHCGLHALKRGKPTALPPHLFAPSVVADGIRVREIGTSCFEVIHRCVDAIYAVTPESIAKAMVLLRREEHELVEGAGAAAVALLLDGAVDPEDWMTATGRKPSPRRVPEIAESGNVCAIVSGGSVTDEYLDDLEATVLGAAIGTRT